MNHTQRVLVTGATGYIGGRLVPALRAAGYDVRCLARDPARVEDRFGDVEIVRGDVFDFDSLVAALRGCDVAYYLVHSMSHNRRDFPGYAWLEFEATARDGGGACLRQTAMFDPRGAAGLLYWYAVLPFHQFIFANMATRVVREAEMLERKAAA